MRFDITDLDFMPEHNREFDSTLDRLRTMSEGPDTVESRAAKEVLNRIRSGDGIVQKLITLAKESDTMTEEFACEILAEIDTRAARDFVRAKAPVRGPLPPPGIAASARVKPPLNMRAARDSVRAKARARSPLPRPSIAASARVKPPLDMRAARDSVRAKARARSPLSPPSIAASARVKLPLNKTPLQTMALESNLTKPTSLSEDIPVGGSKEARHMTPVFLVVGVGKYRNAKNLVSPAVSGRKLADGIRLKYPRAQVWEHYDENATLEKINRTLGDIELLRLGNNESKPWLVVFLSGHGLRWDGQSGFCCHDYIRSENATEGVLRLERLREFFETCAENFHTLLLADFCYAGGVAQMHFEALTNAVVLASCLPEERAFEIEEEETSLFSKFLLGELYKGNTNTQSISEKVGSGIDGFLEAHSLNVDQQPIFEAHLRGSAHAIPTPLPPPDANAPWLLHGSSQLLLPSPVPEYFYSPNNGDGFADRVSKFFEPHGTTRVLIVHGSAFSGRSTYVSEYVQRSSETEKGPLIWINCVTGMFFRDVLPLVASELKSRALYEELRACPQKRQSTELIKLAVSELSTAHATLVLDHAGRLQDHGKFLEDEMLSFVKKLSGMRQGRVIIVQADLPDPKIDISEGAANFKLTSPSKEQREAVLEEWGGPAADRLVALLENIDEVQMPHLRLLYYLSESDYLSTNEEIEAKEYLSEREEIEAKELLAALEDGTIDTVKLVRVIYYTLTPEERKFIQLLATFRASRSNALLTECFSFLFGNRVQAITERAITKLCDTGLLVKDRSQEFYTIHRFIRDSLAALWSPSESEKEKWGNFAIGMFGQKLTQQGALQFRALRNLRHHCRSQNDSEILAEAITSRWNEIENQGFSHVALRWIEQLLGHFKDSSNETSLIPVEKFTVEGESKLRVELLKRAAILYRRMGQDNELELVQNEMKSIRTDLGRIDPRSPEQDHVLWDITYQMGEIARVNRDYSGAFRKFYKVRHETEARIESSMVALKLHMDARYRIGEIFHDLTQFDAALAEFSNCTERFDAIDGNALDGFEKYRSKMLARVEARRAAIYLDLRRFEEAKLHASLSLEMNNPQKAAAHEMGDVAGRMIACIYLAQVNLRMGELDIADFYARSSIDLHLVRGIGEHWWMTKAYCTLTLIFIERFKISYRHYKKSKDKGDLENAQHAIESAEEEIQNALRWEESSGKTDDWRHSELITAKGLIRRCKGDMGERGAFESAGTLLNEALESASAVKNILQEARIHFELGSLYSHWFSEVKDDKLLEDAKEAYWKAAETASPTGCYAIIAKALQALGQVEGEGSYPSPERMKAYFVKAEEYFGRAQIAVNMLPIEGVKSDLKVFDEVDSLRADERKHMRILFRLRGSVSRVGGSRDDKEVRCETVDVSLSGLQISAESSLKGWEFGHVTLILPGASEAFSAKCVVIDATDVPETEDKPVQYLAKLKFRESPDEIWNRIPENLRPRMLRTTR